MVQSLLWMTYSENPRYVDGKQDHLLKAHHYFTQFLLLKKGRFLATSVQYSLGLGLQSQHR